MRTLSREEYDAMMTSAAILARNDDGGLTARCADGLFVKVFRRPKMLSTSRLRPLWKRFVDAARQLEARSIPAPTVSEGLRIPHMDRTAIRYRGLEGDTLREALGAAATDHAGSELLRAAAAFIARLHKEGVFFRGLHFDNVLVLRSDGRRTMGLIDIGAARFRKSALGPSLRARNLRHLVRYAEDRALLERFGLHEFLSAYLAASKLSGRARARFLHHLARQHAALAAVAPHLAGDRA